jgi:teichuronic acid exporter
MSLRRPLFASGFLAGILTVASGTVVTQAMLFVASPILSRVFSLQQFGNFATYSAWVAALALLSSLRYEQAIIIAKGRESTNRAIALTVVLTLGSFVVYSVLSAGIHFVSSGAGYLAHLRTIVVLIPIGTLATCFSSLFIEVNIKNGRFRRLAYVAALQGVLTLGIQIILGRSHVEHALILGAIAGFAVSGAVLAWFFVREDHARDVGHAMRSGQLRATAREHVNFPRYALAADAITIVGQQFIPVFVLAVFSPAVAGLYAFTVRVVRVPLVVLSTAVATAMRKEAIDLVHDGRSLHGLFSVTVRSLALMSLVPFALVLLSGPSLFTIAFGAQWVGAGRLAQILSAGILVEFIAMPLASLFLVTNTQRSLLTIQAVGFALLVLALFLGKHYLGDFMRTCVLVSTAMVAMNCMSILLAGKVTRIRMPVATVARG